MKNMNVNFVFKTVTVESLEAVHTLGFLFAKINKTKLDINV